MDNTNNQNDSITNINLQLLLSKLNTADASQVHSDDQIYGKQHVFPAQTYHMLTQQLSGSQNPQLNAMANQQLDAEQNQQLNVMQKQQLHAILTQQLHAVPNQQFFAVPDQQLLGTPIQKQNMSTVPDVSMASARFTQGSALLAMLQKGNSPQPQIQDNGQSILSPKQTHHGLTYASSHNIGYQNSDQFMLQGNPSMLDIHYKSSDLLQSNQTPSDLESYKHYLTSVPVAPAPSAVNPSTPGFLSMSINKPTPNIAYVGSLPGEAKSVYNYGTQDNSTVPQLLRRDHTESVSSALSPTGTYPSSPTSTPISSLMSDIQKQSFFAPSARSTPQAYSNAIYSPLNHSTPNCAPGISSANQHPSERFSPHVLVASHIPTGQPPPPPPGQPALSRSYPNSNFTPPPPSPPGHSPLSSSYPKSSSIAVLRQPSGSDSLESSSSSHASPSGYRGQRWLGRDNRRTGNNCVKAEVRGDVNVLESQLLALVADLEPLEEERRKMLRALSVVQNMLSEEWPGVTTKLFGSSANDLCVRSNNDIDVSVIMPDLGDDHAAKGEVVERLAELARQNGMEDVLALPRARVPVCKMIFTETGTKIDVVINNTLAVENTRLLKLYASLDPRVRQLIYAVKLWAKKRKINDTYRGTLSSYAYVILVIFTLQQRSPPLLPVLQAMEPTYKTQVGRWTVAYADDMEQLENFGAANKETLVELLASFFATWAWWHNFDSHVVSVRCGRNLSKNEKGWTQKIGTERHLVCIEDPFDLSHDLGRTIDRFTRDRLHTEFERAASLFRNDPDPLLKIFEPRVV